MLVVELSFLLDKPYIYYENLLKKNGLNCVFECITHDVYYSKNDFNNIDNMTEKEIKESCIRLRQVNNNDFEIQNNFINKSNKKKIKPSKILKYEKNICNSGYKKVFDTIKIDHHWCKEGMTSRIQLQETNDIGLLLFFDNKDYYDYDLDEQRKKLIDELNSYGFTFKYNDLCIDKLRTLYYRNLKYSKNSNS